jgi:hypothetical protein
MLHVEPIRALAPRRKSHVACRALYVACRTFVCCMPRITGRTPHVCALHAARYTSHAPHVCVLHAARYTSHAARLRVARRTRSTFVGRRTATACAHSRLGAIWVRCHAARCQGRSFAAHCDGTRRMLSCFTACCVLRNVLMFRFRSKGRRGQRSPPRNSRYAKDRQATTQANRTNQANTHDKQANKQTTQRPEWGQKPKRTSRASGDFNAPLRAALPAPIRPPTRGKHSQERAGVEP